MLVAGQALFMVPAVDQVNHSAAAGRRNTALMYCDAHMTTEVGGGGLSTHGLAGGWAGAAPQRRGAACVCPSSRVAGAGAAPLVCG